MNKTIGFTRFGEETGVGGFIPAEPRTAGKLGTEEEMVAGLHTPFEALGSTGMVGQLATCNVIHSADECMGLVEDTGFTPLMMPAAKKKSDWSATLGLADRSPTRIVTISPISTLCGKSRASA